MGQRTQIIINCVKKDGTQSNKVYHCQWGNGRVMPLLFLGMLNADYQKNPLKKDYDFFTYPFINTESLHDITDVLTDEERTNIDVNNVAQMKDILERCDNNNGAMVVQIKQQKETYMNSDFKLGFLLGPEDVSEPFKEYVSLNDFQKYVGGRYFDNDIKVPFEGLLYYFEVKVLGDPNFD